MVPTAPVVLTALGVPSAPGVPNVPGVPDADGLLVASGSRRRSSTVWIGDPIWTLRSLVPDVS